MEFTVGHTLYGANAPASVTRYALRDNYTPRSNFSSSVIYTPRPNTSSSIMFERDDYCTCCRNALKIKGPTLTIDAPDNTLVAGVGTSNLDLRFQRENADHVDTDVICNFDDRRGTPRTLWVRTTRNVEDDMTTHRTDLVTTRDAVIDCRIDRGCNSIAVNTVGPNSMTKVNVDPYARKITVQPNLDVQGNAGEVKVTTSLKGGAFYELTVRRGGHSTVLELC